MVLIIPYLFFGVITVGAGFWIIPAGVTFGVFTALTGDYPNAIAGRQGVIILLSISIVIAMIGIYYRKKLWGKIIVSIAFYIWALAGVIGLVGAYG